MKGVLVLLLLLSVAFGALSLTPREQEGLQAILEAFPVLTAATPPWSSNISEACNSPGFYGITCTSDLDAHVLKLYVWSFVPTESRIFNFVFSRNNFGLIHYYADYYHYYAF